jgi:predicted nucleic acid-binding protein
MGRKSLESALSRYSRLGIDSVALIYLLEDVDPYAALVEAIFESVERGKRHAYASSLALTEILVPALREKRYDVVRQYRQFLLGFPNLKVLPVDIPTAELAASLRAQYELRTPDAIHIATALEHGAQAFLTNDKQLTRVKELPVLLLDSFL